jgi:predicted metal-dependent hydrolase
MNRSLRALRSGLLKSRPEESLERVQVGSSLIAFSLERTNRRKTVSIIISDSGIQVRAPMNAPLEELHELVRQRSQSIRERERRFVRLRTVKDPAKQFVSGECVRLLGRQFILKRFRISPSRITINGRFLELRADSDAQALATLEAWYRAQALERGVARATFWAKRLGVPTPNVLIRDQAGRWGSCNAKGELRLNWRIVMAPQSLFDYVIAHEVCHLRVPNHSSEFWGCLRQVMPDFVVRRERLALEGQLFVLETV